MKKRFFCILLLIVLLVMLLPTSTSATGEDLYYITDDGQLKVKKASAMVGTVTLPTMVDGIKVTGIKDSGFAHCENLTGIVIPEGVTRIGYAAFNQCTALESVTLPSTLTVIGGSAFTQCESLKSIVIPEGVTVIPNQAFHACYALEQVTLPEGITSIGESAFYATAIESISIPESVTSLGKNAFHTCKKLKSVVLPWGLTSIPEMAFYQCYSLEHIAIPGTVTYIGKGALTGASLKMIVFGSPDAAFTIDYYDGNEANIFWKAQSSGTICVPSGSTEVYRAKLQSYSPINNWLIHENTVPEIKYQPTSGSVALDHLGSTVSFSCVAPSATGYRWHVYDKDTSTEYSSEILEEHAVITVQNGSTWSTLTIEPIDKWLNGKRIACEVYSYGGTVFSNKVTITVYVPLPEITKELSNASTTVGVPVTFHLSTSFAFWYEWDVWYEGESFSLDDLARQGYLTYTPCYGTDTDAYLEITPLSTWLDGKRVRCTAYNDGGYITSYATLTVAPGKPIITKQPEPIMNTMCSEFTYSIRAINVSKFEWDICNEDGQTLSILPYQYEGVFSDTFCIVLDDEYLDGTYVICRVSNAYGTVNSTPVQIRIISSMNGDVNLDGCVTYADVVLMAKGLVGCTSLTTAQKARADMDNNGRFTSADLAILVRTLTAMVQSLP